MKVSINSKNPGSQPSDETSEKVEELVASGRYADAAGVAKQSGAYARAADLFERVWDFDSARECAELAGDTPRALRNALDARDAENTDRLVQVLSEAGSEGKQAALELLAQKRHFAAAAPLAEFLGDLDRAVELYRSGHLELEAARLLESMGRDNEAGRLLERLVAHSDLSDESARAHLLLGTILARRMRHDDAVRHLQEASKHQDTASPARRLLIVELAALGLRDAARDVLVAARADGDELSVDLDEVIRQHRPTSETPKDSQIIGGRYRLQELLGAGGAGRVFVARDEVAGRRVAVKLFSTGYARGHQGYERFVREARIASALKHANLVEAFDFSAEQGYLVMEYMSGGSLATRLRPRLSENAARRMALDVLGGLELAHRRGVIHRDVKPANIFFDARGTAKLGDFGVAHLLDLGQTQTGGLIGTLAYMSPEQITGAPLTIAADLYAVGITLFEAITGRLPFQGPDFVAEHLGVEPPAISDVDAELAPGWDPIIARLLVKSPSDRFESVDKLRRALTALELGSRSRMPLLLPKARASARRAAVTEPPPIAEEEADSTPPERYVFETSLQGTSISKLSRAVDSALGRSVIIERYDSGSLDPATEHRLYALARGGGPFLQRALAFDKASGIAIFEAPTGVSISEVLRAKPPSPQMACRLLKRLARALAPLHEAGNVHGALSESTVLIDELGFPTAMVAGLGPAKEATPQDDVASVIRLVGDAVGLNPDSPTPCRDLVDALAAALPADSRTALAASCPVESGESLYELADAIERAILHEQRGAA